MEDSFMTNGKKLGEVSWDEVEVKQGNGSGSGNGESIFLNMKEEGKYRMRIASKPHQYYCHWVKTKSGKNRKVNATLDGTDPVCLKENKGPQLKWLFKVLFRDPVKKTTSLKILDAGSQVMAQIKTLHEDKENFGNISKYDILVIKGPKNSKSPTYTVQALGSEKAPQALTPEEIKMVKDSAVEGNETFIDMKKFCQSWTAERIMNIINEVDTKKAPEAAATQPVAEEEDQNLLDNEKDFLDLDRL
jgi:hypothetical protein